MNIKEVLLAIVRKMLCLFSAVVIDTSATNQMLNGARGRNLVPLRPLSYIDTELFSCKWTYVGSLSYWFLETLKVVVGPQPSSFIS